MNPEIEEMEDLIDQMKFGSDNIEAIQEENTRIYEATDNLYKLIKIELGCA